MSESHPLLARIDELIDQARQALADDDAAKAEELLEELSQNFAALGEALERKTADAEPEPPNSEPTA